MERNIILYVGGFELPDKNAAAHRVVSNANCLQGLGYEVIFIGVNKEKETLYTPKTVEGFEYYEIMYPKSFLQWVTYISSIYKVKKIIEESKIMTKIDSVFVYNFPSFALLRMLNFSKKNNVRIFADVTEWSSEKTIAVKSIIKNFDTFLRMRFLHFKVDGVIAISAFLTNYYERKVKVIQVPPLVNFNNVKWKVLNTNNIVSNEYSFFMPVLQVPE
ncbi:hypothetical protein [Tenacibaculum sp. SG-28]|uniref:hypothetical protein n=1 Tax=Tenacibaculum sp. SG-28 TaxID=754426 RepID=UPI000CF44B2E|nr:hypothetical protein [Tenacibaculum sp. SG-28]PQJ21099.1 hypothetical protein BSU00_08790 [Tenacibaculum sp. SG-28]